MLDLKRDLYFYFMSRKYKFHDNDELYVISFVPIIIGIYWIDLPAGRQVFLYVRNMEVPPEAGCQVMSI